MIGFEDSPYTYEYNSYYKIFPSIHNWSSDPSRIRDGKKVSENFTYSSDTNKDWLTISEFKKWLTKNKLINDMENEVNQMIGYYWKGLEEKDRLEAIEKVNKIFLKGGKEFFAELKKTQPITEIP